MPKTVRNNSTSKIFSNAFLFVFLVVTLGISLYLYFLYFAVTLPSSVPVADTISKPKIDNGYVKYNYTYQGNTFEPEDLRLSIEGAYSINETFTVQLGDYSYKLPNFFIKQTPTKSVFLEKTPYVSYSMALKQPAKTEWDYMDWGKSALNVYRIPYTNSIKDWLRGNVSYQGISWGDSRLGGETYVELNIKGITYYAVGIGCCGGSELVYITKTPTELLFFSTDNRVSYLNKNSRSFLIEAVLNSRE